MSDRLLVLVRHGQSEWNLKNLFTGWRDIDLTEKGVAAIAFDVVFSEPDRLNPDVAANSMRYLDEMTRSRLRELPSNDQVLADAIRSVTSDTAGVAPA